MDFIALIIFYFVQFYNQIIKPVIKISLKIYYYNIDKTRPLPKCKNDLLFLPANILAKKIRRKEITSTELIEGYIDRIKEIQPLVNCVVYTCFEEALQEAKKIDEILSREEIPEQFSENNSPLLGIPFSCKESLWVKDAPNSSGLVSRKDFRAPEDAVVVKNVKQAGAILTCLTNTSEICMWCESSNYLYGTTRNPYNLSRIPGGSSGGEGCLISSCGSILGLGTDIGGSIRIPSYFNGVYGHKPSIGLVSNDFQFPPPVGLQEKMLCTGPICRYASDLNLIFKVLAGDKYEQIRENFEQTVNLKNLNYFYIDDLSQNVLISKPSKHVKNALNKAILLVENSFELKCKEIKSEKLKYCFEMWCCLLNDGKSRSTIFSDILSTKEYKFNYIKEFYKTLTGKQDKHTLPSIFLAFMETIPTSKPEEHLKLLDDLRLEIQELIGNNGIIFLPTYPDIAPYHNQTLFTNTYDYMYYGVINALGFPSTQIPLGLSPEGLPLGVQIIANINMDHLTIKLAEFFESNLVGWIPPF